MKQNLIKCLVILILVPFIVLKYSSATHSNEYGSTCSIYDELISSSVLAATGEESTDNREVIQTDVIETPNLSTPQGRAAALGLPEPPDIDIDSWEFILANGEHSIEKYEPSKTVSVEGQIVDERIAEALKAMAQDSRNQGLQVYLSSGYRSYSEQAANFTRVCQNNGITDGKNSKGFYITMPAGCSEHQTGLCCDITDVYYATKTSDVLEKTELYQYMSKHCQEFGFIVRFPDGDQQQITGVMYEPWHYRYVGVEAATYIMDNALTLEEFIDLYIPGTI